MARRRSKKKNRKPKADESTILHLYQYEITDEPIEEPAYRRLPEAVKERLNNLNAEAQLNPQSAIVELLELKKKYPRLPQIYNYLAVAYSMAGESKKAEEITKESIRKNPNYLFAKINYAQYCLHRGEYEKIPEIFNEKYDLQMLYPKRKKFHISEVVNFMGVIGLYFVRTDQREIAERYNQILQEIAPDYPAAERLNFELNPGSAQEIINKLLGI